MGPQFQVGRRRAGVLDSYRHRFAKVAKVAKVAGDGDEFARVGDLDVIERVEGIGMTDQYGVSGRTATGERGAMTEAGFERKLAVRSDAAPGTCSTTPGSSRIGT